MKSVLVFVFALCAVASAYPRPANEESKEDEPTDTALYIVPLNRAFIRRPAGFGLSVRDHDDGMMQSPLGQFPFRTGLWDRPPVHADADPQVNDFMTQMQAMLTEMRRQLTEMVRHTHVAHPDQGSGTDNRFDEDDLPKNKSTSTTKVIDGHVVTVNETTYSSGDDNIGAVFRIKVVEVKPSETPDAEGVDVEDKSPEDDSEEVTKGARPDPEPTTSKSELVEDVEDNHEETNEIPNQKVQYEWNSELDPELDPSLNEISQPEEFVVEQFTPIKKENYYDLSSDTKVNDYISDHALSQGLVMIDPDAEVLESNSYYHYDSRPQRLQRFSQ